MSFPLTTIRDTVKAQLAIASALNIRHINTLLGGSCGGYQALEFAHAFTGSIDHMVLLATGSREMPWNKAIHEAMRLTLKTDPTLEQGDGSKGLQAARAIGMLNYRTAAQFNDAQPDHSESLKDFKAPSYIRYHGQKLVDRFDAACYYKLTEQLDTHHIGRGRGGLQSALGQITVPTLVIGISSDVLIPVAVQEELATNLPNATLKVVDSEYGHDGFLIEYPQINAAIAAFYHE
jgi:homoserine O-acetyltransferase